jgi:hypothetical protein
MHIEFGYMILEEIDLHAVILALLGTTQGRSVVTNFSAQPICFVFKSQERFNYDP